MQYRYKGNSMRAEILTVDPSSLKRQLKELFTVTNFLVLPPPT